MLDVVLESVTNLTIPMSYKTKDGIYRFTGSLFGTVTSGHPTLTTLGNTLRVLLYNEFWLKKAGVLERSRIYVSGDDTLLFVPKDAL